jgi:hypothetical protein
MGRCHKDTASIHRNAAAQTGTHAVGKCETNELAIHNVLTGNA